VASIQGKKRNRVKHETSLAMRLKVFADELRARASEMPSGPAKESVLKRLQSADMAFEWASSPEQHQSRGDGVEPAVSLR